MTLDPYGRTLRGQPIIWQNCVDLSALAEYSWKTVSVGYGKSTLRKKKLVRDPKGLYTKYGTHVKEPYHFRRAAILGEKGKIIYPDDEDAKNYLNAIRFETDVVLTPLMSHEDEDDNEESNIDDNK